MEGYHGDGHGLHPTKTEGLRDGDGLFREKGVLIVYVEVLFVCIGTVVGVELDRCCRQQVNVGNCDHAAVAHLNVGGGTVGDCHETAESGQVGVARVGGQDNARATLDDIAGIAVVSDVEDAHLL